MVGIKRFFSLLWDEYNYQLLLISSTLVSLIIESILANTSSTWRLVPQAILLVCLVYFLINTYLILKSIRPSPHVAYALCIGKPSEWFDSFARKQQESKLKSERIRWEDVKRIYRIHSSDWVFNSSRALGDNRDEWTHVTGEALTHFWSLMKRVEDVPIHHFFFIAPPSIVFTFGAYVGRKVPNKVYHHIGNTSDPYLTVFDTTKRDISKGLSSLNSRIQPSDFEFIAVEESSQNQDGKIIITLDFTNHRTSPPFLDQENAKKVIRVLHVNGIGHIPSEGWEGMAKEIASLILNYCDKGEDIDLYINMPLPLAFILGSIVGPIQGIMLCEYNIYSQALNQTIDLGAPELQGLGRDFDSIQIDH